MIFEKPWTNAKIIKTNEADKLIEIIRGAMFAIYSFDMCVRNNWGEIQIVKVSGGTSGV